MKLIVLIILVNVVVFIFQNVVPELTGMFMLISADVISRPWVILTSMFLHGSLMHLFYNMFALFLFGLILESIIGGNRFILVYFLSGTVASVSSVFFYDAALGASGAVYGVLGCLAMLRPKMVVWTYYVPMPMYAAIIFWALLDLAGVFYPTNIANIAHLTGLFSGLVFGWRFKMFKVVEKRKKQKVINDKELDEWEKHVFKK